MRTHRSKKLDKFMGVFNRTIGNMNLTDDAISKIYRKFFNYVNGVDFLDYDICGLEIPFKIGLNTAEKAIKNELKIFRIGDEYGDGRIYIFLARDEEDALNKMRKFFKKVINKHSHKEKTK